MKLNTIKIKGRYLASAPLNVPSVRQCLFTGWVYNMPDKIGMINTNELFNLDFTVVPYYENKGARLLQPLYHNLKCYYNLLMFMLRK